MTLVFHHDEPVKVFAFYKKSKPHVSDADTITQNFIKILERRLVPFHSGARRKMKVYSSKDKTHG